MKKVLKYIWKYLEGVNGLLLIIYSVFIFSTALICVNDFSLSDFIKKTVIVIIACVIICPLMIKAFSKIEINNKENRITKSAITHIVFYIISFGVLLANYLSYYPGGFSVDSFVQYEQAITNHYNDWHPVFQTLFAFKLPLVISRGWLGSIVLFQIICLSAVLGYSLNTILKYTNFGYALASALFILLNPQFGSIAMYPWKDITFAIGALLLTVYSLRIFMTKGEWIKPISNTILYIVTASFTTMSRHNALLFTIPLVIAVLFYITKKKGIIITICIMTICLSIKYPIYSAMGVERPDKRQIETLGLPMTVIGGVVANTPEALDEETRTFAYKIAPKEVWEESYVYGSYNTIKHRDGTNNDVIEEYGAKRVVSMMLRCFKYSPRASLTALIKLTEASYSITDNYDNFKKPIIINNEYGISQCDAGNLTQLCNNYRNFFNKYLSYPFLHLGLIHLILIITFLSKCKLNKITNLKKILFALPVFTYNLGTSLLLTSIDDSSRFFFYTYLLLPLLLIIYYLPVKKKKK